MADSAEQHGVQLASAALLLGENRGLGITGGIAQLLTRRLLADTEWNGLDYLVVDLPPGTADIQQFVFALSGRALYAQHGLTAHRWKVSSAAVGPNVGQLPRGRLRSCYEPGGKPRPCQRRAP